MTKTLDIIVKSLYLLAIMQVRNENGPYIVGLFGRKHYTVTGGNSRYDDSRVILFDGKPLLPYSSLQIETYSLDFDWGNIGLGTKQLALAILLQLSDHETAKKFMHDLVLDLLARLYSHKGFAISTQSLLYWLKLKKEGITPMTFKLFETARIIEKTDKMNNLALGVTPPQGERETMAETAPKKKTEKKYRRKYAIHDLGVGQSFFVTDRKKYKNITVCIAGLKKRSGKDFETRAVDRNWCVKNGVTDCPNGGWGIKRIK